jgi:hypothetical protein
MASEHSRADGGLPSERVRRLLEEIASAAGLTATSEVSEDEEQTGRPSPARTSAS